MSKKTTTRWLAFTLAPIAYVLSYNLLLYYKGGDPYVYTRFYKALRGADLQDATSLSRLYLCASEPIPAYIMWFGANFGIEKNIYVSLINVIFIVSLFLLARKNRVKMPMIGLLLTNFYVCVLMTSAERLKFAYILIIIAMLFERKIRIFLLACSPFAHFQNAILLLGVCLTYFEGSLKNLIFSFRLSKKLILSLIGLIPVIAIIGYYLFNSLTAKFNVYSNNVLATNISNMLILIPLAVYVSRNRFRMLLVLLPLIPVIMIIGADRVNMIGVTLALYFLMEERRMHHPLIYLLMSYFSIKTIFFVQKIILYGDGFVLK